MLWRQNGQLCVGAGQTHVTSRPRSGSCQHKFGAQHMEFGVGFARDARHRVASGCVQRTLCKCTLFARAAWCPQALYRDMRRARRQQALGRGQVDDTMEVPRSELQVRGKGGFCSQYCYSS